MTKENRSWSVSFWQGLKNEEVVSFSELVGGIKNASLEAFSISRLPNQSHVFCRGKWIKVKKSEKMQGKMSEMDICTDAFQSQRQWKGDKIRRIKDIFQFFLNVLICSRYVSRKFIWKQCSFVYYQFAALASKQDKAILEILSQFAIFSFQCQKFFGMIVLTCSRFVSKRIDWKTMFFVYCLFYLSWKCNTSILFHRD